VAAATAASAWLWRRNPQLGFLPLAFALVLAPTSSFAPTIDLAFEHRIYLSLACVAAAIAVGTVQSFSDLRLSMHLCFGNYKGRSVGKKTIAPMLPDFLDMTVDELHSEMTILNFSEVHLLERFAEKFDVAVGVIDVKSYYIETPEDVAERIRKCLPFVPAEKLAVAPDCGLSQTARWAAKQKLANMVAGAKLVREEL
jgi:methionine synthase II (cobalamin-independent)